MDWIEFENQAPKDGQLIWGMQPSGSTELGTYSAFDGHHLYMEMGNHYIKIIKWATYDVIY